MFGCTDPVQVLFDIVCHCVNDQPNKGCTLAENRMSDSSWAVRDGRLASSPKETMQYFFKYIISYIVTPGNLKFYYILPGRTIGYKSGINLPTLQPGTRLSRSGSSVWTTTQDNGSNRNSQPKTATPQKGQTEWPSGQAL
jgi:hypothetical protein